MLYRIYTERKNVNWIADVVGEHFSGFTLIEARGYWNGDAEDSLIIEISAKRSRWNDIVAIARQIRDDNQQEAVLIDQIAADSTTVR